MSMSPPDDEVTRFALAAKAGDRSAAAAFARSTHGDLHRFFRHMVGPEDADDLTQETFLRAMRSLPRFDARSAAKTWLFAIARHVAADHVRFATRRPRTSPLAAWEQAAERRAGSAPLLEDEVVLRRLVQALAPDRREAFAATQILGLTYEQAADMCGCPVGTIRSRVSRAREDLIAALRDADDGPRPHRQAT